MKRIALIVLALLIGGGLFVWTKVDTVYESNVSIDTGDAELFIYPDMSYAEVEQAIFDMQILDDTDSFTWVAEKKSYPRKVKPGRYVITDGMSNNELVNMLRSGSQKPVKLSFNNVRNLAQLSGKLSERLAPDSLAFLKVFKDPKLRAHYGFQEETFMAMFIPNTYEFYWTTSPEDFVARMAKEFKSFWTDERVAKAKALGLSQSEVVTLASIVQAEQSAKSAEWRTIAGLYLNRIRRGIPLQSDPTVIFATGDFSIKRVLNRHLKHNSPYNTYQHTGLPPGPIRMPDIGCVDAVLNPEKHDYIFMCAHADLSGAHHFSKTNREHERYARAYRKALDEQSIMR